MKLRICRSLYRNDGYVIVGSVQDKEKSNNVQLIFYKSEARTNSGERPSYDIKVEAFAE